MQPLAIQTCVSNGSVWASIVIVIIILLVELQKS
jgi:hypothetical protein